MRHHAPIKGSAGMTRVAVLIPTKGRAMQMLDRVSRLMSQKYPPKISLLAVLSVPYDDEETLEIAKGMIGMEQLEGHSLRLVIRSKTNSTTVDGSNRAYIYARNFDIDWYVHGHDDLIFSRGWLEQALRVAETTGAEVVGLNDLHTNLADYSPFWMVTEEFIRDHLGGLFVPPMYKTWWFDREICQKARALGLYAPAPKAIVEHTHPDWHTANLDATYYEAMPYYREDEELYRARMARGFPVDYLAVVS